MIEVVINRFVIVFSECLCVRLFFSFENVRERKLCGGVVRSGGCSIIMRREYVNVYFSISERRFNLFSYSRVGDWFVRFRVID